MDTLFVDTGACNDPARFAPRNRLRVVEHKSMGFLPFNLDRVRLCLTEEQVSGHKLLECLEDRPVLNANYLDAWKALIGDSDKETRDMESLFPTRFRHGSHGWCLYTFFWGTVYENNKGLLFVRYACKTTGQKPYFGLKCLDDTNFRINCPAALWT